MTYGCEDALDWVGGAQVLPVLGRKIVERQRFRAVLGQALDRLGILRLVFCREDPGSGPGQAIALAASARLSAIQMARRSALAVFWADFGSLLRTFDVL